MNYALNPIDNLKELAAHNIALLHVCGNDDDIVPMEENTLILKERYQLLGGNIQVISKPNCGHHPHSLQDPEPILQFILKHSNVESD